MQLGIIDILLAYTLFATMLAHFSLTSALIASSLFYKCYSLILPFSLTERKDAFPSLPRLQRSTMCFCVSFCNTQGHAKIVGIGREERFRILYRHTYVIERCGYEANARLILCDAQHISLACCRQAGLEDLLGERWAKTFRSHDLVERSLRCLLCTLVHPGRPWIG